MKSFASDNYSGVCQEVMEAIIAANHEHESSYGLDRYTEKARALLKKTFGEESTSYFVYNGTAANVLGLKAITRSHHAILCAEGAHIASQEVGAPVNAIGCSLITVLTKEGKVTPEQLEIAHDKVAYWGVHSNLPKVVSIAQTTEYGTVYSINELKAISHFCKQHNLLFHMDGCRLANAAVSLGVELKKITQEMGVDVLSFGGAKNGLLFGEVIVFFDSKLANEFDYIQKQSLQLHSKMRFLSAQFIPYLEKNIWHRNAKHANDICQLLAAGLKKSGIKFAYPVESNQIFAFFPDELITATQGKFPYYVWNKEANLVRLITSFDTTENDVNQFVNLILK